MGTKKMIAVIIVSISFIFSIATIIYAKEAEIEGTHLNVRSGPGSNYEMIDQVNPPESYNVLDQQGNWVQIDINSTEGWVHQDYVTISEDHEDTQQGSTTTPSSDADQSSNHQRSESISDKLIVIDPGHGGRDVGAIGASGNYESTYTLTTANVLKQRLEALGAEVILTRTEDRFIPLTSRVTIANTKQADLFLSLHYNSTPELPNVTGAGTYYYSDRDKQLAEDVQFFMVSQTGMNDRGVQQEDLQVLRTNHRPSLLLELGFISNQEEEHNIQSKAYLDQMSRGITKGIHQYFQSS
ncbi:putative N-acetylmuramoyl-L-alanine amidase [Gracilibacillus halophilus YIM-C55.5]|uniref:Putative N-acetylmuramoyl-L-alanine amidase n=1 Tax=Gracilibacillus halophilus YIM-C55.5 TaxID=1308866 RepID=N4WLR9_9BACI|nr:N-acetylmuramoyl-L-alanine amidase [Gracilibacillus halophilus]ENH97087.1 putative N-acetylmuramoyl-L-alanine amidase [Gracilibacillus halophilus YIM-C55.5]